MVLPLTPIHWTCSHYQSLRFTLWIVIWGRYKVGLPLRSRVWCSVWERFNEQSACGKQPRLCFWTYASTPSICFSESLSAWKPVLSLDTRKTFSVLERHSIQLHHNWKRRRKRCGCECEYKSRYGNAKSANRELWSWDANICIIHHVEYVHTSSLLSHKNTLLSKPLLFHYCGKVMVRSQILPELFWERSKTVRTRCVKLDTICDGSVAESISRSPRSALKVLDFQKFQCELVRKSKHDNAPCQCRACCPSSEVRGRRAQSQQVMCKDAELC